MQVLDRRPGAGVEHGEAARRERGLLAGADVAEQAGAEEHLDDAVVFVFVCVVLCVCG